MTLLQWIIANILSPLLGLLMLVFFIYMIFSWLIAFNIVNLRNPAMRQIHEIISRICEPILEPVRRFIPPLGGLDMAFLVVVIGIFFVQDYLLPILYNAVG